MQIFELARVIELLDSTTESIPPETLRKSNAPAAIVLPGRCISCNIDLPKYEAREHFRSDWHNYNIKYARNISLIEFEAIDLEDSHSIDGSVSSSDEDEPNASTNHSPFVTFIYPVKSDVLIEEKSIESGIKQLSFEHSKHFMQIRIYKQVLSNCKIVIEPLKSLKKIQMNPKVDRVWVMMMIGGGHFSAAVYTLNNGKVAVSKSFHRYTVRKGQGGTQSANDNAKGKAKSAGSGIRRHNEQALIQEIQLLLSSNVWKNYIYSAELVWVRATSTSRKTIFFNDALLDSTDPRVRSFPFTTKRPTLAEISRCYRELTTIEPSLYIPPSKEIEKESSLNFEKIKTHLQIELEPISAVILEVPQIKLIEMVTKGRNQALVAFLLQNPSIDINQTFPHSGSLITYLHLASIEGEPEIINTLLEHDANPTILHKNKPAFELCSTKECRDVFRRFMYRFPTKWRYQDACIPTELTPEMEDRHKEREKERKGKDRERMKNRKVAVDTKLEIIKPEPQHTKSRSAVTKISQTQLQSIGMTPEARLKIDREKRAMAVESRMRTRSSRCSNCEKPVDAESFEKGGYRYCSMECIKVSPL